MSGKTGAKLGLTKTPEALRGARDGGGANVLTRGAPPTHEEEAIECMGEAELG